MDVYAGWGGISQPGGPTGPSIEGTPISLEHNATYSDPPGTTSLPRNGRIFASPSDSFTISITNYASFTDDADDAVWTWNALQIGTGRNLLVNSATTHVNTATPRTFLISVNATVSDGFSSSPESTFFTVVVTP
jgi:hypothetical protein